ncbi:NAD(P)/FAD-dependent oxidoreductase [Nocardia mangyaensis]|nr:FAD-dependent oxidoreductase [Nocardia mangyaensis]
MTDPIRADVAIVGAGVIGCLIARELSERRPDLDIVVVDRGEIGGGASRYSAGLDIPRGNSERVRRMAAYGQRYFADIRWAIPMTVIAHRTRDSDVRERYLEGVGPMTTPAVHRGLFDIPPGHIAWHGNCAYTDVHAFAQQVAREVRSRVRFHEGIEVLAVEPDPDGIQLRLGTGRSVRAALVVVAPGPWTGSPPWPSFIRSFGIRVKRVVALHLDRVPDEGDPAVIFDTEDAFLLPMHRRRHWLLSYTSDEWDVSPDRPGTGLTAADLAAGHRILERYAPHLIASTVSGRVFCDAYSPDREPLVRSSPADPRVVFAGAANGSGYRLGPAIAAETADLLEALSGADVERERTA